MLYGIISHNSFLFLTAVKSIKFKMNFEMKNIERQMLMYKYELITMYSFDLFLSHFAINRKRCLTMETKMKTL